MHEHGRPPERWWVICGFPHEWYCGTQEPLRVGVRCWVLHPQNGIRPVAEGIAGSAPVPGRTEGGACRSLLTELSEDGKQTVKVTKIHKTRTDLMFPVEGGPSRYLDDYIVPPAPPDTYVTWLSMWLEVKPDDD